MLLMQAVVQESGGVPVLSCQSSMLPSCAGCVLAKGNNSKADPRKKTKKNPARPAWQGEGEEEEEVGGGGCSCPTCVTLGAGGVLVGSSTTGTTVGLTGGSSDLGSGDLDSGGGSGGLLWGGTGSSNRWDRSGGTSGSRAGGGTWGSSSGGGGKRRRGVVSSLLLSEVRSWSFWVLLGLLCCIGSWLARCAGIVLQ